MIWIGKILVKISTLNQGDDFTFINNLVTLSSCLFVKMNLEVGFFFIIIINIYIYYYNTIFKGL